MGWLFPLIGGLGIGSLLKGIVDHFLTSKSKQGDRIYQEKKEIYLGILNALHDADIHPSLKNAKAYGLWQCRCELFGSERVSNAVQMMIDTNEDKIGRAKAHRELLDAMRADLSR